MSKKLCPGNKSEFFSHEIRPGTKPEAKFPGEHVHTNYVRVTMSTNYVNTLCPKKFMSGKMSKKFMSGKYIQIFFPMK